MGSFALAYLRSHRQIDGWLSSGLVADAPSESEKSLLIEEVKVGCTLAMLQCLDRPHRLAFILGDIMELSGPESAEILEISPDLFRKRLQSGRAEILELTKHYCGLASDTAACQCNRRLHRDADLVDSKCRFAVRPSSFQQTKEMVRRVDEARWALEVHRSSHPRGSSLDFARRLVETLDAGSKPPH